MLGHCAPAGAVLCRQTRRVPQNVQDGWGSARCRSRGECAFQPQHIGIGTFDVRSLNHPVVDRRVSMHDGTVVVADAFMVKVFGRKLDEADEPEHGHERGEPVSREHEAIISAGYLRRQFLMKPW